jgi:hypothetical protein
MMVEVNATTGVSKMSEDARPTAYPPWRNAMELFFAEKYGPGDVLTHEWLHNAFNIEMPTNEMPYWKAKQLEFLYMGQVQKFQQNLLRMYQIDIMENVRGIGYEILHPGQQVQAAETAARKTFRRVLQKRTDRLINIRYPELTHRQRREHADALARLGFWKAMYRQDLDYKSADPDDEDDDEVPEGDDKE